MGELDQFVSVLQLVRMPTLLPAHPQEALVPVDTSRRLQQALPDAHLQLVEGSGHHLLGEQRTPSPTQ